MARLTESTTSTAPASPRGAIAAACIGNLLEWYDFTVYALFATYIARSFFPSNESGTALVKTFLTFGAGFIARPLGAVLIGAYGDRAGRKAALLLTIWIMAGGTLLIAVAPDYASIGVLAPWLLLLGRLLQGLSAGGEIGSASAFLVESASAGARGRLGAWQEASMGLSNILGALVAFTVSVTLSGDELQRWGWRIPFAVGLLIAPAGVLLRRSVRETAEFEAERARRRAVAPGAHTGPAGQSADAPLRSLLRDHGAALMVGFGLSILWAVAVYVLNIYTPVYVQGAFGFTARQAFAASLIGNVFFVLTCLAAGRLSDRIGRATVLTAGALALLTAVLPLYLWLRAEPTTVVLVTVQSAFCVMVGTFVGVAPAALSDLFPTSVRSTGISLVYNGAFVIFGGFAPAILTWFTHRANGSAMAPAAYVICAAAVGLATMPFFARRRGGQPTDAGAAEALA
jgi:MHS family proline/betaine transporter-like MFS transporter